MHPLLGAFAAGRCLVRAARVRPPLLQSIQTLTTGFLAPIFFASAGTQVNLARLGGWGGIRDVAVQLVASSAIKIGFCVVAMGARAHRGAAGSRLGYTVEHVLARAAGPTVVLFPHQ